MIQVRFPETPFRIKEVDGKHYIFDNIRKIWLLLTEEEWVRQNFVSYLITDLKYPSTLIALEKEIMLNGLRKRFDIMIYDKDHHPWLLVECKEPKVPLGEDVLMQALRYNLSIPVKYIVLTNGGRTLGINNLTGEMLQQMPEWK
jgi:hypothetical protein